jgi:hypothetical protein
MKFKLGLLALILIGCGSQPIGRTCSGEGNCEEGLTCITEPSGDDAPEWCEGESYCTLSCVTDDDCTDALGEGHICADECGVGMCFEGSSS